MDKVLHVLKENQVLQHSNITNQSFLLYDRRAGQEPTSESDVAFEVTCSNAVSAEKGQEVAKKLNQLNLPLEFSQTLGVGQKMPAYKNFHKVFSEEQAQLVHQPGEVLLVDVWATWCGPCQNPMKHNQEMLEKNEEKWKGKARIVAVSVDDDKQVIQNRVNTKGWTKIEHLTLLGWDGAHPLIQNFQIQGIPFVFLVDKEGKIDYTGHPSQTNLEERINELINRNPVAEQTKETKSQVSTEELLAQTKKIEALSSVLSKQTLDEKFAKAELFSLMARGQIVISQGKISKSQLNAKISTWENTSELIDQFMSLLKDVDPKTYTIEKNLVKFEVPPKPDNAECADCKSKVEYPFYWCKWDPTPNNVRCRQCIEKKPTEEGKHYSYLHNSVLLTGPWERIPVKGFGNDIQPEGLEKVEGPHSFCCNSCGMGSLDVGEARYICLGCRSDPNYRGDFVDLCQKCTSALLSGDEAVINVLKKDNHNLNHPLLRVLYNTNGYYSF